MSERTHTIGAGIVVTLVEDRCYPVEIDIGGEDELLLTKAEAAELITTLDLFLTESDGEGVDEDDSGGTVGSPYHAPHVTPFHCRGGSGDTLAKFWSRERAVEYINNHLFLGGHVVDTISGETVYRHTSRKF